MFRPHGFAPSPPDDAPISPLAERRYRDLVKLAYLVLPGDGRRIYRLAIAQRIVDGVMPAARQPRNKTYARMRTRVLRRSLNPPRRLRIGLKPWLRALPAKLPDPALTLRLAMLEPEVRVAYVLKHVERLPKYAVRDQLVELDVADPGKVLDEADAVAGRSGPAAPVEMVLGGMARRRSRVPVAAACALTAGLVAALLATEGGGSTPAASANKLRLKVVPADAWRTAPHGLDAWPARGELVLDKAFLGRARAAWARRGGGAAPQLLFAGRVGREPAVLLRGGTRAALYHDTGRPADLYDTGSDGASPFALGHGRYLVAPWVTGVRSAGHAVPLSDGTIGAPTARNRCQHPLVLEQTTTEGTAAVADLGGPRPLPVSYRSPSARSGSAKPTVSARWIWDRLDCALPDQARAATAVLAWEFWRGTLPGENGTARWVCARYTLPDGRTVGRGTLLEPAGKHLPTGDCGGATGHVVSGTWWHSPAGRWLHLAAAGRGETPRATGPVDRVSLASGLLVSAPRTVTAHRPADRIKVSAG